MSAEENKTLAHTLTEKVWNKGNLDIVDDLLSTDYVFHHPGGQDLNGPEEYKQMVKAVRSAFPDIHFTIDDVIAEGDKVAYRWTFVGTHQGELRGIPPTGKKATVWAIAIERVADGKFVEAWERYDTLGLMRQLGVIKE